MKILIVKLSAIGDVIMATTMLAAIQQKYGNCDITWVCGKSVYQILCCYHIHSLISIDESKLLMGNKIEKLTAVISLWKKIGGGRYDLVVTAHSDKRYSLLTLPIKAKRKVYFNKFMGRKIPVPGRYHGDEYARLITEIDDHTIHHWYPMMLPNLTKPVVREFKYLKNKIIVIAPGGAKNIMRDDHCRRWPIEKYSELAKRLLQQGYSVAITGSSTDNWIEPYFSDMKVINFVGRTSLKETMNIFIQADVIVTHDSGPLHLAILVRANVIALFGPTIPSEKVPTCSNIHILWNDDKLACCPCYDGKKYADCNNNQCLKQISVDKVLQKIREIKS